MRERTSQVHASDTWRRRQPLQRRGRAGCILSQRRRTRIKYTRETHPSPGAPGVDKFANKRAEWARHNTRDRSLPASPGAGAAVCRANLERRRVPQYGFFNLGSANPAMR